MTIRLKGLDKLQGKIDKIKNIRPALEATTMKAALYVHQKIPAESSIRPPGAGEWAAKTSRAMKAAFFAKGGGGGRTGGLLRSITSEVKSLGSMIVGVIGTNVPHAIYVISRKGQAFFHQGRWPTLEGIIEKERSAVIGIYKEWLRNYVK